mmetsp:Transcript_73256/g.158553  ORF Transcript_73256/g.158553 Transcript_73256/m.158553 type:complete len:245 (+) Transcript_73256:749-1483(+)
MRSRIAPPVGGLRQPGGRAAAAGRAPRPREGRELPAPHDRRRRAPADPRHATPRRPGERADRGPHGRRHRRRRAQGAWRDPLGRPRPDAGPPRRGLDPLQRRGRHPRAGGGAPLRHARLGVALQGGALRILPEGPSGGGVGRYQHGEEGRPGGPRPRRPPGPPPRGRRPARGGRHGTPAGPARRRGGQPPQGRPGGRGGPQGEPDRGGGQAADPARRRAGGPSEVCRRGRLPEGRAHRDELVRR